MKKILFLVALAITLTAGYAQQGEIIYTDFEPDSCVTSINPNCFHDTIKIDFDQNGIPDFKVYLSWRSTGEIAIDMISSWEHRYKIYDSDSIVPSDEVYPSIHYWLNPNWPWQYMFTDGITHLEDYIGFCKTINGENYYAWAKIYADIEYTPTHDRVWAYVDRIAFCTIPDYPLRWGQTSLIEGFKEPGFTSFATLHPNPTNSMVIITDENLRQAEVINMLGQQVLSVEGRGNELQIDMAALPAGVYFVTITDDDGRKCVRKVAKE